MYEADFEGRLAFMARTRYEAGSPAGIPVGKTVLLSGGPCTNRSDKEELCPPPLSLLLTGFAPVGGSVKLPALEGTGSAPVR